MDNNPYKYSDLLQPDDTFEKFANDALNAKKAFLDFRNSVESGAKGLKEQLSALNSETEEGRNAINELAKKQKELSDANRKNNKLIEENEKLLREINEAQKQAISIREKEKIVIGESAKEKEAELQIIKQYKPALNELRGALDSIAKTDYNKFIVSKDGFKDYSGAISKARNDLATLQSVQASLKDEFDNGAISLENYDKMLLDVTRQIDSVTKASTQLEEQRNNARSGAETNTIADGLFAETPAHIQDLMIALVDLQEEQGRTKKAIKDLDKSYKDGEITEENYIKSKAKLTTLLKTEQDGIKSLNRDISLQNKLNVSNSDSYNKLSAQYSLNKIALNGMSEAYRTTSKEGKELEAETEAIYERMKELQEATGKHQLNVGNYADSQANLTTILYKNVRALTAMKMAGKEGTDEYEQMRKETIILKGELANMNSELKSASSNTSNLDSVLGATAVGSGGFAVFTSATQLFGNDTKGVEEAQKKLQTAIALTTGVQAIQNNLMKHSALMLGINKIQTSALSKAEAYRRLIQIKGTKATVGATMAQKAFNLVAMANPYVLLAMALVTLIGALVIFTSTTAKAGTKQKLLNDLQKNNLELLEQQANRYKKNTSDRLKDLESDLKIAKAREESYSKIQAIEDDILKERKKSNAFMKGFYADELKNLDENKKKLQEYEYVLKNLNDQKATGNNKVEVDVDLNGNIDTYKVDDAIEIIQGKIDSTNKMVAIGVSIADEDRSINDTVKNQTIEREKLLKDLAEKERSFVRDSQDQRLKLMNNSYDREAESIRLNYSRQIADLQRKLDTDNNLTTRSKKALNSSILSLQEQLNNDLKLLELQNARDIEMMNRTNEDIKLSTMLDSNSKRLKLLELEHNREIEDIKYRLESERDLTDEQTDLLLDSILLKNEKYAEDLKQLQEDINISNLQREQETLQLRLDAVREGSEEEIKLKNELLEKQRQLELSQNAKLAEELQQSETDINAKYDNLKLKQSTDLVNQRAMMLFDAQQEYDDSEFALLRNSEERKTQFRLNQEKARLKKILELNEQAGVQLSDLEVATIKNTIERIDQEVEQSKKDERSKDIYGVFGLNLDDKQKEAIDSSVSFAIDQLGQFLDAKVQMADRAVDASQREIDASQKRLDYELEMRSKGHANNVATAQKDLELARKNQEKALKDQEKARKAQERLQTLQQATNLVTASALIWSQLGFPFAIPALGVMWGSFAMSKIKAAQMSKQGVEEYGDGTVELLKGGSHQSGNDIDLGTTPDGKKRRAEGGEYFAVINKKSSQTYDIPDIINSLNRGTFANKYLANGVNNINLNVKGNDKDLKGLSDNVREIKESNERRYYTDGKGRLVEIYKGRKTIHNYE